MRLIGLIGLISLISLMGPTQALAQSQLKSTNYTLDGVNIGSMFTVNLKDNQPPQVTGDSVTVTLLTDIKATFEWKTDKKSSTCIQSGKTTSYDRESCVNESTTSHKITVVGLEPETTYHYRAKSVDNLGNIGFSGDKTLTTPGKRGINNIRISGVTYTSAEISWSTSNATKAEVRYGTSTNYSQSYKLNNQSFATVHRAKLENLASGTEYHVQIVATDEQGEIDRSSDLGFTTIAEPKFESVSVVPKSANEVGVNWQTNTETSGIISYRITATTSKAQDVTGGAELTAGDSSYKKSHTVTLRNLVGNSTYRFEVVATDTQGRQVKSGVKNFDTPIDRDPPKISQLRASVTRSGGELVLNASWETNEPTKSKAVYSVKNNLGESVELPESPDFTTAHTLVATGLQPASPYVLKAIATDPFSNESQAEILFVSPKTRLNIFAYLAERFSEQFGWLVELFSRINR